MKKTGKLIITLLSLLVIVGFSIYQLQEKVFAEQSGSSPESGATSRIKTAYDWLVAKGANYGATDASDWSNNWGSMWNRIMEAAAWEPDGTATEADVATTKTFYAGNGDRTIKTGTAPPAFDYSTQRLATKDDFLGTYKAEESTWTAVSGSPFAGFAALNLDSGTVKQDSRTGLWWSARSSITRTNSFTLSADGVRPTGGQAIDFCDALNTASYGGKTDWYLPTQKELMTAYINGIYSQDSTFATTSDFWSSTEVSAYPARACLHSLVRGDTVSTISKTTATFVRCVRRD